MAINRSIIDLSTKPDSYFSQRRVELVDFIPLQTRRFLDVGCGEGSFGAALKQTRPVEVWGIEIMPESAALARQRIDHVLTGDIMGVLEKLPDSHFDCISFNDVLEHTVDPYSLLRKIKRKIAPQGVIVSSIPNVRYFRNLFNIVVRGEWRYEEAGIMDKTHLRFFTRKSIAEMFASLGYRILRFEGINPTSSWRLKLLNLLTFGFFTDTKYMQFCCVAAPLENLEADTIRLT